MLISRNNADICARYWPIDIEESMTLPDVDLQIFNTGIDKERDPLFRVTKLKLVGPNGEVNCTTQLCLYMLNCFSDASTRTLAR